MRRAILLLLLALTAALAPAGAAAQAPPGAETVGPGALSPADPAVAAAPDGAQIVAMTGRAGGGFAVLARSRSRAGGPWGPPVRVSPVTAARPGPPAVALAPGGMAVAVWTSPGGRLAAAVRPAAGAAWSPRPIPDAPAGGEPPVLALGEASATVAWAEGTGGTWRVHRAVLDLAAGAWTREPPLAADGRPSLAAGPGGDVAAAWSLTADAAAPAPVSAALRPASGSGWEAPRLLSGAGADPAAAVAADGTAAVAWLDGPGRRVAATVRPGVAADWPPATDLGAGSVPGPRIAIGSSGAGVVAWPGPAALSLEARRLAGGAWGPPITLVTIPLSGGPAARVAVDALGNGYVAWIDPEGPGSAGLLGWVLPPPSAPLAALRLPVNGDGERFALATDGAGDALVASTRSLATGTPALDTEVVMAPLRATACAAPPRERVVRPGGGEPTPSAAQLRINQRIASAAIRRARAISGWLDAGIEARDLCGGAIVASALGPGLDAGPPAAATALRPAAPRPLAVAPAPARPGARFALTAGQLRTNQRIAAHAVRLANAIEARLRAGLSGGDLAPGALAPETLAPTVALARADEAPAPPPTRTRISPAPRRPGAAFTVSAAQLRINQRIAQAAVRRVNALRARLLTGLTASDLRARTVTAAALARPGPAGALSRPHHSVE